MNIVSRKLIFIILSAAVLVTGCTKKPKRPDPSATVLGQGAGFNGALNPIDVSTTMDPMSGLEQRDAGFDMNGQMRGVLESVYFDFDKSSIKTSERGKLEAAAKYLKDNPTHRLLLEGHCDWRGTAEYNLGLGDRRASAAKQFLGTLGVSADKLETLSKGSLEAVKDADKGTAAKDRRVELVVVK
ncbi:MAG: OmpA family protein [Cephaloticoccus sp.]|nr:OmpA family protein [Cephaloticoccus sp.]MCF7760779.1 OmpA family protein [Cephaloticoccus sp.]